MSQAIAILYATRNGFTRQIAERLSASVQARGFDAKVIDAAHVPEGFSLSLYDGAILAASVHGGMHEREMSGFVKLHTTELEGMPAAFLSVSMSEVGVEEKSVLPEPSVMEQFLAETGWHPHTIKTMTGALLYTQSGFLVRVVMKRMASGGSIDSAENREYRDWTALDHFAGEFLAEEAAWATC